MHGQKQKLQDIYTNAKLDYLQRKQPVVVLGKDILWIRGLRKVWIRSIPMKRVGLLDRINPNWAIKDLKSLTVLILC